MAEELHGKRLATAFSERLTLRGLRVFVALEEMRSIALTAKTLKLSKSNVSQHITTLENNLGAKLFDRKQKPISLTPIGQVLSLHAHRILATVHAAETSLAEMNLVSLPNLNFAVIDDLDASLTPILASSLQAQMSQSFIRTYSGRSDEVTARLVAREADIAVTAMVPADIQKFQIQQLFREKFVLVTAKGAYAGVENWRDTLSKLPFIAYSEAMPMGQIIATHLKRIHFDPPGRYSFETSRSVIATVARTGGWALTTPLSILDGSRFRDEIEVHPLPFASLSRRVHLISRTDELGAIPEILAKAFRTLLHNELLPEFVKTVPNIANAIEIFDELL